MVVSHRPRAIVLVYGCTVNKPLYVLGGSFLPPPPHPLPLATTASTCGGLEHTFSSFELGVGNSSQVMCAECCFYLIPWRCIADRSRALCVYTEGIRSGMDVTIVITLKQSF